jgi:hypothetical protein
MVRLVERRGAALPQMIGPSQLATLMRRHGEFVHESVPITAIVRGDAPDRTLVGVDAPVWLKLPLKDTTRERESLLFYLLDPEPPVPSPRVPPSPEPLRATGTGGVVVAFRPRR